MQNENSHRVVGYLPDDYATNSFCNIPVMSQQDEAEYEEHCKEQLEYYFYKSIDALCLLAYKEVIHSKESSCLTACQFCCQTGDHWSTVQHSSSCPISIVTNKVKELKNA